MSSVGDDCTLSDVEHRRAPCGCGGWRQADDDGRGVHSGTAADVARCCPRPVGATYRRHVADVRDIGGRMWQQRVDDFALCQQRSQVGTFAFCSRVDAPRLRCVSVFAIASVVARCGSVCIVVPKLSLF